MIALRGPSGTFVLDENAKISRIVPHPKGSIIIFEDDTRELALDLSPTEIREKLEEGKVEGGRE